MSGYDIKETLKSMDAERWSGLLIGSIYNALNKLEKEGYIEVSHIEQTGHRQKAIYAITNRGKEYEKQLTKEALEKPLNPYPTQLYSGFSFMEKLDRDEALAALRRQQKKFGRRARNSILWIKSKKREPLLFCLACF
ncbi:transcriptional regulator, PadR family [Geomicrobium sp. JCM 19037]|uniref:PadR family transcriptional regulator n=1 Tax=Geomicrobium sp. JCM 19037 TaxID=1460634 RepID=UPI00045F143C|nr:PadR family transcriptional regulator [Geomicrobium sp. JCM 19037]GAK01900.1 transcriptional regulator, PadR family [Geomicrobium sp. JCM 19037]